jgi:hypothetical protein
MRNLEKFKFLGLGVRRRSAFDDFADVQMLELKIVGFLFIE